MDVRLILHLEPATEHIVWWGESPDVPGFTVTDVYLDEVLEAARTALTDILAEQGQDLGELITYLAGDPPVAANGFSLAPPPLSGEGAGAATTRHVGLPIVSAVRELVAPAA